ncbi:putative G-protein coupled receptor 34b [Clarias gariepinus]
MSPDVMADHNSHNISSIISTTAVTQKQGYPAECLKKDDSLRVTLAVFYTIFFVLGLAGNLLALWVFLWLHSKKNSVRIFLINLAIADLVLMICLPFRVAFHANHNQWNLHPLICKIVGNVFYMNMYISIILLGLISIDRYVKLQRASSRQKFLNSKQSTMTCCLLWVTAAVFIIPLIVVKENSTAPKTCFQYKALHNVKWKAYANIVVVIVFWVVYGTLVTSYAKIAMGLLQISKKKPDFPNAAKYSRTAWKSFFVLFLFTVCFVPYHLSRIFYVYSQITTASCLWIEIVDKINELSLLLSALNSCLDPIMYFVLCGSVRRTVLQVLNKYFCLSASAGSSSTSYEIGRNQREQAMQSDTSTV